MLNDEQKSYVVFLASLPASAKCECGWDRRGECWHCNRERERNLYERAMQAAFARGETKGGA